MIPLALISMIVFSANPEAIKPADGPSCGTLLSWPDDPFTEPSEDFGFGEMARPEEETRR